MAAAVGLVAGRSRLLHRHPSSSSLGWEAGLGLSLQTRPQGSVVGSSGTRVMLGTASRERLLGGAAAVGLPMGTQAVAAAAVGPAAPSRSSPRVGMPRRVIALPGSSKVLDSSCTLFLFL